MPGLVGNVGRRAHHELSLDEHCPFVPVEDVGLGPLQTGQDQDVVEQAYPAAEEVQAEPDSEAKWRVEYTGQGKGSQPRHADAEEDPVHLDFAVAAVFDQRPGAERHRDGKEP